MSVDDCRVAGRWSPVGERSAFRTASPSPRCGSAAPPRDPGTPAACSQSSHNRLQRTSTSLPGDAVANDGGTKVTNVHFFRNIRRRKIDNDLIIMFDGYSVG